MSSGQPHSTSVHERSQGGEPPWDLIAARIDQFAAAWDDALSENAEPPRLDAYTADLDDDAARQVLIELAKLDIERRWQTDYHPRTTEWYVGKYAQLGPVEDLPAELIYEEFQARMAAGRPIYQEEVRERFPRQAAALLQLLGGMAFSGSPTATYFGDTVRDGSPPDKPPRTPSTPFASLQAGDRLDDFQLIAPLGSGAFARVFLARQLSMERMVALKVSTNAGSEPQTLAQLDHPHIVRVFDQRECSDPAARLLYMEVVSGGTLHDVVARGRNSYDGRLSGQLLLASVDDRLGAVGTPVPETSVNRDWIAEASWPEVVARLGAELAEGLAYAHGRGVMHRDIKPANVLLSAEGRPKLADFNVSYNGGRADENPEDTFGGSLAYMSPEQLEACHPLLGGSPRLVRETSDLYALGVMLWELLAGRRPFRDEQLPAGGGGSLVRLQRMIETRRKADFRELQSQLPDETPASLREVLVRCLQADKSKRYQTAQELGRALRLCLNPRCWKLLQEPTSKLGRFALRWPILTMVLAGLIPNLFTAGFNLAYNWARFNSEDDLKPLYDRFMDVQAWINGIAFPIGIAVGAVVAMRIFAPLRGKNVDDALAASGRVLSFGQFLSFLLLAIWTVSGMAFPVAIGWDASVGHGASFYLHFFLSLALCGVAATTYPYMLTTAISVHYFLPALVRRGLIPGPKRSELENVGRMARIYLAITILVPMIGILMMSSFLETPQPWARRALIVVSAAGTLGFIGMLALERMMAADIDALGHIAIDERRAGGAHRSNSGQSGVSSRGRSSHDRRAS